MAICSLQENQQIGLREIHEALHPPCRKLHQDPRIKSNFPQFFPKPVCTGFQSCDPGAYPCRVAALVSTKTPEFLLSCSYQLLRSTFYLAGSLSITFLHIVALLWSDLCIVRFLLSYRFSHVRSIVLAYKYRALLTLGYPSRIPLPTSNGLFSLGH
jgi:hypothetical protein